MPLAQTAEPFIIPPRSQMSIQALYFRLLNSHSWLPEQLPKVIDYTLKATQFESSAISGGLTLSEISSFIGQTPL
jgi:hypothetical protein